MLQLSNSQKFSANTWHLPQKIINLGELQGISKLPIRLSTSADDRNTFSFVCVSCACGACTRKCFALKLSCLDYVFNSNCSRIWDAFNQKAINISNVFHVFMFIILYFESNFFFLIDCFKIVLPNCTAILISLLNIETSWFSSNVSWWLNGSALSINWIPVLGIQFINW